MSLDYPLERRVVIAAERSTVFRYFTDSERFAAWWGQGSEIDPRVGGKVKIRYPNEVIALGEVLEIVPGERIVFSYGYEAPDKPIRPGGSRVTISLERAIGGTLVSLVHDFADAKTRDHHVAGWRHQLAVFANLVAKEQHRDATRLFDDWFAAWNESDVRARDAILERATAAEVSFRDAYGCTEGRGELSEHITAVQLHLANLRLARDGAPKLAHGVAVVSWVARSKDDNVVARGSNVFELAPEGPIARVIGIWDS